MANEAFRLFECLAEIAIGAPLLGERCPFGDGFTFLAQATPTFDTAGEEFA